MKPTEAVPGTAAALDGPRRGPGRRRLTHERRIVLLALLSAAPAVIVAMALLWTGDLAPRSQWTLTLVVVGVWISLVFAVRERVAYPLRTLANLLSALREGDYSMRARSAGADDALGEVALEVNDLGRTLREQRLGVLEATALLRTVMAEIDVAIFAFDQDRRLRLVNQRGEILLGRAADRLVGRAAADLGLDEALEGAAQRILDVAFPGGSGRWELRRSTFREKGLPHQLLVLSDLTATLREEERQAWHRLVQVLRHEINNSLAPIQSIADSLASLLARSSRPDDWESDLREGLEVIANRSQGLGRFLESYTKLTRLPEPRRTHVDVGEWVRRIAQLETRLPAPVEIDEGPDMTIEADGDQLDQLLINLLSNAADAALETGGGVRVGWRRIAGRAGVLEVRVDDEGPGVSNPQNLFIPFFTTKPEGSGIGLVLSRQIAEAHGGSLTLVNRDDGRGCRARLRLPIQEATERRSDGATKG